jgi:hypothetical protein
MLMKIVGRVRGLFAGNYPENREEEQFHLNSRGDQIVVQGLPELTELVRLGDSWQVANATGQAALTALPTTVAGLTLWNGEPATGKSYAIDSFGSWEAVVDATQTDVTAIFACNNKTPVTAPTDAALAIRSLSGKSYGGKARTVAGGTIVNDGWFAHGTPGAQMAAAAAGANWKVNEIICRGLYLVPPGGAFNVQAVKAAAAAAAQQFFFVRWHEVQLIYRS